MGYGAREKNEKDRNAKSPRRKDAKSFFQLCRASAGAHAARFAGPRLRRDRPSGGARCPTLRERRQVGAGLGKQARFARRWRTGMEDILLAWAGGKVEESPAVREAC